MNLSSYAELAVRLANTAVQANGEPDPLGSTAACAEAFSDCITLEVRRRDLDVLRYLREEFTAIFSAAAAGDQKASVARLNALIVQFPIQPELVSHDDQRWHVHLAPHGTASDQFAAGAVIGLTLMVSMYGVSRRESALSPPARGSSLMRALTSRAGTAPTTAPAAMSARSERNLRSE